MSYKKNQNCFKKVKIDISKEMGIEDVWVVLKEPTVEQAYTIFGDIEGLKDASDDQQVKALTNYQKTFSGMLPKLIVDSNFFADDTETAKMSNAEIAEVINSKLDVYQKVFGDFNATFLTRA